MAILRERQTWRRKSHPTKVSRGDRLTPEEQKNVQRALRAVLAWYGSWPKVAAAVGYNHRTLKDIAGRGPAKPTPGLAIRAAQAAGQPVEDVLTRAWPKPGSCPMCGHLPDGPFPRPEDRAEAASLKPKSSGRADPRIPCMRLKSRIITRVCPINC